jgi:hypothetical protein
MEVWEFVDLILACCTTCYSTGTALRCQERKFLMLISFRPSLIGNMSNRSNYYCSEERLLLLLLLLQKRCHTMSPWNWYTTHKLEMFGATVIKYRNKNKFLMHVTIQIYLIVLPTIHHRTATYYEII